MANVNGHTKENTKHTQGGNRLNTITKLIGVGVIIGLNGLNALGNRINIFYEGGPTLVAEGIDGVELPQELSDPSHDLWDEYDPYVKFVGIKLNLPEELIADCEDNYWRDYNKDLFQKLKEILTTEDKFHAWCDKQEKKYSYGMHHIYAYILKKVNEKNYLISLDFCEQVALGGIIECIYYKGATRCMNGLYPNTMGGRYLKNFGFKW